MLFPRLGNHHHHGMCKASPRQGKKFQAIIEFLGIRTVLTNDRKKFVKIISKNFTCNLILPSIGPVFIAPNRVNFTVMAKVSEGLSPWPTWKSVCRKAGMCQG